MITDDPDIESAKDALMQCDPYIVWLCKKLGPILPELRNKYASEGLITREELAIKEGVPVETYFEQRARRMEYTNGYGVAWREVERLQAELCRVMTQQPLAFVVVPGGLQSRTVWNSPEVEDYAKTLRTMIDRMITEISCSNIRTASHLWREADRLGFRS